MPDSKVCHGCMETKPLNKFYTRKYTKDGYTYTCKSCIHKKKLFKL